jgi:cytochrome c peroxidase
MLKWDFSGQNGRPGLNVLLTKLQGIAYYNELFKFAYNDLNVTEARVQECLAQFIRSIQSFDSKYDAGRSIGGQ